MVDSLQMNRHLDRELAVAMVVATDAVTIASTAVADAVEIVMLVAKMVATTDMWNLSPIVVLTTTAGWGHEFPSAIWAWQALRISQISRNIRGPFVSDTLI